MPFEHHSRLPFPTFPRQTNGTPASTDSSNHYYSREVSRGSGLPIKNFTSGLHEFLILGDTTAAYTHTRLSVVTLRLYQRLTTEADTLLASATPGTLHLNIAKAQQTELGQTPIGISPSITLVRIPSLSPSVYFWPASAPCLANSTPTFPPLD